jgi:hypothetical protein
MRREELGFMQIGIYSGRRGSGFWNSGIGSGRGGLRLLLLEIHNCREEQGLWKIAKEAGK